MLLLLTTLMLVLQKSLHTHPVITDLPTQNVLTPLAPISIWFPVLVANLSPGEHLSVTGVPASLLLPSAFHLHHSLPRLCLLSIPRTSGLRKPCLPTALPLDLLCLPHKSHRESSPRYHTSLQSARQCPALLRLALGTPVPRVPP